MSDINTLFTQHLSTVTQHNQVGTSSFKANVVCPTCHGYGQLYAHQPQYYDVDIEYIKCYNCDGKGLVEVNVKLWRE